MIRLTRLNHAPIVLNSDLIEHVEVTPDTIISLMNGQKLIVLESAEEVVDRIVAFRRRVSEGFLNCPLSKVSVLPADPVEEELQADGR